MQFLTLQPPALKGQYVFHLLAHGPGSVWLLAQEALLTSTSRTWIAGRNVRVVSYSAGNAFDDNLATTSCTGGIFNSNCSCPTLQQAGLLLTIPCWFEKVEIRYLLAKQWSFGVEAKQFAIMV